LDCGLVSRVCIKILLLSFRNRLEALMNEHVWRASPSLALIKYWGKAVPAALAGDTENIETNIPASFSLALGLDELWSETRVSLAEDGLDHLTLDGRETDPSRHAAFFSGLRSLLQLDHHWVCQSENNFPTAAGLASSSSGFAALAAACAAASASVTGRQTSPEILSQAARIGSASAARAVWPGFVVLEAGASQAEPLYGADHWPDLRVIVVRVSSLPKDASSRDAMEATRMTSPYYAAWLLDSPRLYQEALSSLAECDLDQLGPLVRASTYRMFGSMLAADPPILYWLPETLVVLQTVARMRREGLSVWETMDAGPQVKLFCLAPDVDIICKTIIHDLPQFEGRLTIASVGGGLVRIQ
jgi:diphosphomevalonate decarboxylase